MIATFPHLGTMAIFCKGIAVAGGFDYVVPPESSRRTLDKGCRNSSDGLCLPYRMILGNFIEALERGADTIIMLGSGPPCRLGLYDLVMKITLKEMGFHYRWVTIPGLWNFEDLKRLERDNIIIRTHTDALVVDRKILQRRNNEDIVFVVNDQDRAEKRAVRLGLENPDEMEILEGLRAGERLVILGFETLQDKVKVKIMEDEPTLAGKDRPTSGPAAVKRVGG